MRRGLHLRRQQWGVAWLCRDTDSDEAEIVFARTEEEARAQERGGTDVERRPRFDRFAPGPVPVSLLLADGWRFECDYCGHAIYEDGCDRCAEEADAEFMREPALGAREVYCHRGCRSAAMEVKRRLAECRARGRAEVARRWPGAEIVRVTPSPEYLAQVTMRFPGGLGTVRWGEGTHVTVETRDLAAWNAFAAKCRSASDPRRVTP